MVTNACRSPFTNGLHTSHNGLHDPGSTHAVHACLLTKHAFVKVPLLAWNVQC